MEDYSINQSLHKSAASKGTTAATKIEDSAEESGWTAYFEDFSNDNHQPNSHYSSISCSSSLISDAATTGASWKISGDNHHILAPSSTCVAPRKIPKKVRLTRTKEISEDDSLEDTASSPVNSPKVSDLKSNDINPRRRSEDHQIHSSLGKETASENHSEIQIEEESKMNFDHGKNDCTELKKRGLCLVPLSMLVNYLG